MPNLINPDQEVGGVTVGKAVERVEAEVARWECNNYVHITRATAVQGKAIQLQTIFSKPGQDTPVPVAVVQVNFLLDTKKDTLTFRFEHQSVRYTVGTTGLAKGKFEVWLDRIVADKLKVKQLTTLSTPFEESRLASFSLHTQAEEVPKTAEQTVHEVDQGPEPDAPPSASKTETSASADKSTSKPPALDANFGPSQNEAAGTADDGTLSMSALLVAIFDAADEEDEHELTHKEVADLLYATPLGLSDWDIKLLLTQALELETGKIQYLPFVEDAPHIIEALVKRRAAYEARRKPGHSVPPESIDLCFGEEIEEVSRAAREAFGEMDKASKGTLSRNEFRSCLQSRSERFSMQEVHMLMQMCKEDEDGQVPYDDFSALLQQLRIAALSNAMVETDVAALRIQLILMLREEGLADDNIMYIWSLRRVLLHAKQICLSRMQIHVILCILQPNEHGEVDAQYFLDVCCTVIPHLYDIAVFEEKASTIAKDKADAQAKQELEELQGLQRNLTMQHVRASVEYEGDQDEKANAPDREAVEKCLMIVGNQYHQGSGRQPMLDIPRFLDAMSSPAVDQCQLSDAELRGFIAEAVVDSQGEVAFVDHIKAWVPVIFELRKYKFYDSILSKQWEPSAAHLVDLTPYENEYPLNPEPSTPGSSASTVTNSPTMSSRFYRRRNSSSKARRSTRRRQLFGSSTGDGDHETGRASPGSRAGSRSGSRAGFRRGTKPS